ncbi:FecR domain-containing protein [Sphingomonas sp. UYEF23]|uniref:FecR family protein n=1 Tax=Sphingomonas sp. UYEF23 TaxID=1756408 RepID=UPI003393B82A
MTEITPDPDAERIREEAAAWIARLQGGTSARLVRQIGRWRAQDPRHEAAYARMIQRFEGAKVLRRSHIYAARPQPARRTGRVAMTVTALCAATLALALLTPEARHFLPSNWTGETASSGAPGDGAHQRHIAAPAAGVGAVGLDDGSVVTLDAGSTIDVAFTRGERRVTLRRGRVRFDVAHDGRPFTVSAGTGSVTARGTMFDVSLSPDGRVAVLLLRGAVDVAATVPASAAPDTAIVRRLSGGEDAAYAAGALLPRSEPVARDAHWADAAVDFDSVTLGYLLDRANRDGAPPLRVSDPSLAQLRVSGRFSLRDHDRLASNLATLLNLSVKRRAEVIELSR